MRTVTITSVPIAELGMLPGGTAEAKREAGMMRAALDLLKRLRAHHPATARHSQQVSRLALMMRDEAPDGLGAPMTVTLGGLLHDVGKLYVPLEILTAERKLGEAEFMEMQQHARRGAALLEEMNFSDEVVAVARNHHERWSGNGYPSGLPSRHLSALSRAVAVADAFSAMIEPRSYSRRLTQAEALAELRAGRGTQFDPVMVDLLHAAIAAWSGVRQPIGKSVRPARIMKAPTASFGGRPGALARQGLPFSISDDSGLDFRAIVECSANSVMVTDADWSPPGPTIRFVNAAFTRLTGYEPEMVLGCSPGILHGPDTNHDVLQGIMNEARMGRSARGKVVHYTRSGKPYWVDLKIVPLPGPDGRIRQFVGFQSDITEDQTRFDQMRELEERDALTGVSNRGAFLDRLQDHLTMATSDRLGFAFIDVDHFKAINDMYGHATGDAVLMALTDVLGANTRRADLIGRLGGEEFGICMPRILLPEARALASRLRAGVAGQPFPTPAGPIAVTCSIGLTMSLPGDGALAVMARADQALYRAKHGGRNRVCVE